MNSDKTTVFENILAQITELGFDVHNKDDQRPWGGFYVIDEAQAPEFAAHFFPHENFESLKISEKLSPKILLVAPGARLSWQYHHRRAEIWKCIGGAVDVGHSHDDEQREISTLHNGDIIKLACGTRHRLIGKDEWGIVAEIWQHIDADNPSNEDDIVRVEDDYGRGK